MKNNIKINSPGQILDYVDSKENLLKLYIYIKNLKKENEKLKRKMISAVEHLKLKQIRLINEFDYVINDLDLDEIYNIIKK